MIAAMLLCSAYMVSAATYTATGTDPITYPEVRVYLTVETDPNKDCITINGANSGIILTPIPLAAAFLKQWHVWDDKGFSESGTLSSFGQMMYFNDHTWVHAEYKVTYFFPPFGSWTATAHADVYVTD